MGNSLQNNLVVQLKGELTTSATTVNISNDLERNQVAVFTDAYLELSNERRSKVERVKGNASGGVLTLTKRGLDQSDSDVEVPSLKQERGYGTRLYITYLSSQIFDKNGNNTFPGTQTYNNIIATGDVSVGDDLTVVGDTTLSNIDVNGKRNGPVVADVTARTALYPAPQDGDMVQVLSLNTITFYQTSIGGRQTLGVSTPPADATEVIKGIQRNATNAEAIAGTLTNVTMTPDDTKVALDNYAITEQLTAGEAMSANDGYRRGNIALNTTTISQNIGALSTGAFLRIGYDNAETKAGVTFTTATGKFLQSIEVKNWKSGTPTGNNTMVVRTSASGVGTIVATSTNTFAESTYSTAQGTGTVCVYTFNNIFVGPGTYYVEQTTDRANSASNYVGWCFTGGSGGPSYHISNTGVWTGVAPDVYFIAKLLENNEVNTKFYKALNTTNRSTILGLVKSSVVADATFTALKKGYVKGFTGLTAGSTVFLQADGTITHTISNKKLGEATASDTILLDIDKHQESMVITRDVSLATGVVTYNHTLGEKPLFVDANSLFARSGVTLYSTGKGIYNGSSQISNVSFSNSGISTNSNIITVGESTTAYQTGFIQNITNTTFDIDWTKVGSPTGTASIFLTLYV